MLTLEAFNATLAGLGLDPDPKEFAELIAAYDEPGRHYHDTRHIDACLEALTLHGDLAERVHEVAIALWFHDAIYDTHRSDNEVESAAWARRFLAGKGLNIESIDRIASLILATKHDGEVGSGDQRLLVDIDLGILGQPAPVFREYDAAIRREFDWVPELQYRDGRIRVLQSFLDRPWIYDTARFRRLFEQQAKANLDDAIARLRAG